MTTETLYFLLGVLSGLISGMVIASVRANEVECDESEENTE